MSDQLIQCEGPVKGVPCRTGEIFTFTMRDQGYYAERGFSAPKRCRECRQLKKDLSAQAEPQNQHLERGRRRGKFENQKKKFRGGY